MQRGVLIHISQHTLMPILALASIPKRTPLLDDPGHLLAYESLAGRVGDPVSQPVPTQDRR